MRINRCSHCGCDEPILAIDGKLYCNNCGMSLEKLEGGLTMKKVELKPCPFCGGEAKIFASQGGGICVKCMKCHCQTENDFDLNYDGCIKNNAFENVVAAWNRRIGNGK